jgi:hypothetical protein
MAAAINALGPDAIVLTEYVPSASSSSFLEQLDAYGLRYQLMSKFVERQNHVLIASRTPMEAGEIFAPPIAPSVPSNLLHVRLPQDGFEILGLRIPDYSLEPAIRKECWNWVEKEMTAICISWRHEFYRNERPEGLVFSGPDGAHTTFAQKAHQLDCWCNVLPGFHLDLGARILAQIVSSMVLLCLRRK